MSQMSGGEPRIPAHLARPMIAAVENRLNRCTTRSQKTRIRCDHSHGTASRRQTRPSVPQMTLPGSIARTLRPRGNRRRPADTSAAAGFASLGSLRLSAGPSTPAALPAQPQSRNHHDRDLAVPHSRSSGRDCVVAAIRLANISPGLRGVQRGEAASPDAPHSGQVASLTPTQVNVGCQAPQSTDGAGPGRLRARTDV